jgi:hypothetical protein
MVNNNYITQFFVCYIPGTPFDITDENKVIEIDEVYFHTVSIVHFHSDQSIQAPSPSFPVIVHKLMDYVHKIIHIIIEHG